MSTQWEATVVVGSRADDPDDARCYLMQDLDEAFGEDGWRFAEDGAPMVPVVEPEAKAS